MKRAGLITIGQSPRLDVTEEIRDFFSGDIELLEAGALDEITEEELAAMAPEGEETALVSCMRDGRQVIFAERHILPRLQRCIEQLQAQGAEVILFLCTGKFPAFKAEVPLIFPYDVLRALLPAIGGEQSLTVIVPDRLQISESEQDWRNFAQKVQVMAASPYGPAEELLQAVRSTPIEGDFIVLDCIGYSGDMKRQISAQTGKRVLLARTLAARVAAELL